MSRSNTAWADLQRRLGLRHPIIQGPFGGGLSSVALAGAVARAGGLGSFGAHLLSPDEIREIGAELHAATGGTFALNLWVDNVDPGGDSTDPVKEAAAREVFAPLYAQAGVEWTGIPPAPAFTFAEQVQAVIDVKPAAFSFVFGLPGPEQLAACRSRGIITIAAATTVAEAKAAANAGVDAVVATGFEAGGHRPSYLRRAEASLQGTFALVPQVVDAIDLPVIAAGGIVDSRGVRAAFALGASAVQVGTAFLATEESNAGADHKRVLRSRPQELTTLSRHLSGRLARFLPNGLLNDLETKQSQPLPYPQQGYVVAPLKRAAMLRGDAEQQSLYASQAVPLVRHHHAAEVMAELVAGVPA